MPPTLAETWEKKWDRHAQRGIYPFQFVPYEDAKRVMEAVIPVFADDHEAFTRGFAAAAEPHAEAAREAEARGDAKAAQESYLKAYGLYRMARFPCMNTEGKKEAYRRSQECVRKAWSFDAVEPERIEMPFRGRDGEGDALIGYLRTPKGARRPPLLVAWAGIDTFKEDCLHRTDMFFDAGMATLVIDMPGTGDSPVLGSEDGERQWDALFDWVATRDDLDRARVGGWGGSFGGYWATKIAHTHHDRFRAVISQGGGAHHAFSSEEVARAQAGGIPWGQCETRGSAFGRPSYDAWLAFAPSLSLLDQGVLDGPSTALLCINGVEDPITTIRDYYLVLEHGAPKEARFVAGGGHMGRPLDGSPDPTDGIMLEWMRRKLAAEG
jgi:hypothetical protein